MAKPISISIPHQLRQAEAQRRIDQGFGQLQSQISGKGLASMTKSWTGNLLTFSASALGQLVTGRVRVLSNAVEIELDLPELLAMLANTIKGRLEKQGRLLLEKK